MVDIDLDIGHRDIIINSGGEPELKDSQITGTDLSAVSDSYNAFKYTAGYTFTPTRIDYLLTNVSEATGNVYAYIYSDNSGQPGSSICGSAAVDITTFEANPTYGWVTFTMSGCSQLSASSVYWLVIRQNVADGWTSMTIHIDATYGNNSRWKDADGTGSWTVEADNQQLNFKIYG